MHTLRESGRKSWRKAGKTLTGCYIRSLPFMHKIIRIELFSWHHNDPLSGFSLQYKLGMIRFFQENLFLVFLGMPFLTLGSLDLRFAERKLVWRSCTAGLRSWTGMTRVDDKTFVVHMRLSWKQLEKWRYTLLKEHILLHWISRRLHRGATQAHRHLTPTR